MSWGQWDAVIPERQESPARLVSVCLSPRPGWCLSGSDHRLQVCRGRVCSERPAVLWKMEREEVLPDFRNWSYTAFILVVLNDDPSWRLT